MPRVCFSISDKEHRAFKVACAKQGVTMNEGGRMMLAFYASGLLRELVELPRDDDVWAVARAVEEFVSGWARDAD